MTLLFDIGVHVFMDRYECPVPGANYYEAPCQGYLAGAFRFWTTNYEVFAIKQ